MSASDPRRLIEEARQTDREGAYVGLCQQCGSCRAVIVETIDVPDLKAQGTWRREVAKFCAGVIRDGLRLEHCTVEEARAKEWNCGKSGAVDCPSRSSKKAKPAKQESLL
jgi:hypothetical protein